MFKTSIHKITQLYSKMISSHPGIQNQVSLSESFSLPGAAKS